MLYTRICSGITEGKEKKKKSLFAKTGSPLSQIVSHSVAFTRYPSDLPLSNINEPEMNMLKTIGDMAERLGGSKESTSLRDHIQKPLNSISVF